MTRGFSSIGLVRPKDKHNVGSVLRAARCYNSSLVVVQGERTKIKVASDTTHASRHMPVIRGEDLFDHIPYGAEPVAVDLVPGAVSLVDFKHPSAAFYIFGPEDGTLGKSITDRCAHKIMVPTEFWVVSQFEI